MMSRSALVILTLGFSFSTCAIAHSQGDDGWWFLDFGSRSNTALNPLVVGIDTGSGFAYSTLSDDDNDGVIHLPPIPDGAGLALGVDADGEVGCDLWDLVGTDVVGDTGSSISRPLLIIAEDVEGEAMGMDSNPFSFPLSPTRTLVPGERLTATNGQLTDWPDLRLVSAGPSVTTLDEYLRQVDSLPLLNGEVIVTDFLLTGTFRIPEPATATLAIAGLVLATRRHRKPTAEAPNAVPYG